MLRPQAGIQVDKFYPPTDWLDSNSQQIDIRKNAENNSIVLLVGHSADFTKYSLLGLLAQVSSGTYDVYIDDVLVGSGVTSNAQYNIDFSTIATSYGTATTPEALVLHKVVIKPNTSGATITLFRCGRTTGVSTTQYQGIMWCHFELVNQIHINTLFAGYGNNYINNILFALTEKGNTIKTLTSLALAFYNDTNLTYVPNIVIPNNTSVNYAFYNCKNNKRTKIKGGSISSSEYDSFDVTFRDNSKLEQIILETLDTRNVKRFNMFDYAHKLKLFPNLSFDGATLMNPLISEGISLYPTKLDVSSATGLTKIGTYGTSTYPMRGLRGLKVSNEAPFSGASPQIDVSYTGLDRDALVELFNSLPTVTGSQTLKCVGATGTANLTQADKDIATNKGWALTLS